MTYKDLVDGSISIKDFYRAKRQAEFMNWVEIKQSEPPKKTKDEVEYFD